MGTRYKYRKRWQQFCQYLASGQRPDSFEEAYAAVQGGISGLYDMEARALWNIISVENIKSAAEIGRNLGGTLFLLACCCRNLRRMLSIDLFAYSDSDAIFPAWFERQGIALDMLQMDSGAYKPDRVYDFVLIDGDHTGEGVARDIAAWKDHARIIAFHDFADHGSKNKHVRVYRDVVAEIRRARHAYGWRRMGARGRSEIVFATKGY